MQEIIKELYHCIVILAIIQLCYSQNDLQNNKFVRKYSRYRYDRASLPDAVENNYEKYLKHPSSDTLNIRRRSTKGRPLFASDHFKQSKKNYRNQPFQATYRSRFHNAARQLPFSKKRLQTSNFGVGANGFVSQSSSSNYRPSFTSSSQLFLSTSRPFTSKPLSSSSTKFLSGNIFRPNSNVNSGSSSLSQFSTDSSSYFYKPIKSTSSIAASSSIYSNTAYFPSQKINIQPTKNFFIPSKKTTPNPTFFGSTFKQTTSETLKEIEQKTSQIKTSSNIPIRKRFPQDPSLDLIKKKDSSDKESNALPRTTSKSILESNGVEHSKPKLRPNSIDKITASLPLKNEQNTITTQASTIILSTSKTKKNTLATTTELNLSTTTEKSRILAIKEKPDIKAAVKEISARNNNDTSVNAIPEYIRNTLLESSTESSTEKIDLEFKPFYSVPARTYGDPTSYEASIFYEPPDETQNGEIYEFDSPPQSSPQASPTYSDDGDASYDDYYSEGSGEEDESSLDDASYIDNSIENDGNLSDDSDPDLELKLPVKQLIDEIQGLKPLNIVPISFSNGNPLLTPQGSDAPEAVARVDIPVFVEPLARNNSMPKKDVCISKNPKSRCLRWTTCKNLEGKFSGSCGNSIFDVCCYIPNVSSHEDTNDNDRSSATSNASYHQSIDDDRKKSVPEINESAAIKNENRNQTLSLHVPNLEETKRIQDSNTTPSTLKSSDRALTHKEEKEPKEYKKEAMSIFEHFPPVRHVKLHSPVKNSATNDLKVEVIERSDNANTSVHLKPLKELIDDENRHISSFQIGNKKSIPETGKTSSFTYIKEAKKNANSTEESLFTEEEFLAQSSRISTVVLQKPADALVKYEQKLEDQLYNSTNQKVETLQVTTNVTPNDETSNANKESSINDDQYTLQPLIKKNITDVHISIKRRLPVAPPILTLLPPLPKEAKMKTRNMLLANTPQETHESPLGNRIVADIDNSTLSANLTSRIDGDKIQIRRFNKLHFDEHKKRNGGLRIIRRPLKRKTNFGRYRKKAKLGYRLRKNSKNSPRTSCAAAMICVEKHHCSLLGYHSETRLDIPEQQRRFTGVPLLPCSSKRYDPSFRSKEGTDKDGRSIETEKAETVCCRA